MSLRAKQIISDSINEILIALQLEMTEIQIGITHANTTNDRNQ